jgi:diguanylate cyclase (GGDEF)-like protein
MQPLNVAIDRELDLIYALIIMDRSDSSTHAFRKISVPRIGLMIIPSDPYWILIYQTILKTNERIGDELIALHPATTIEQLDHYVPESIIDQVLAHDLDALITTEIPPDVLAGLLDHGLPVICLAEVVKQAHPLLTIFSELYEGGYIAGEYIAQQLGGIGHAMVVSAAKMKIISVGQSRLKGFIDALHGFPDILIDHIPCYWGYNETYAEMINIFEDYQKPIDAIFGISDSIMFAVRDAGLKTGKISQETILVGLNGDPQSLVAVAEGTFSATVDIATEQVGIKAMEFAHQAALGKPIPKTIPQQCKLVTAKNVADAASRKLAVVADLPNYLVGYDRQKEHERVLLYAALVDINHQIGSLLNHEQLSKGICDAVRKGFGYEWTRILRYSESEDQLVDYGGDLSPCSRQISLTQDWLLKKVIENGESIIIPDIQISSRWKLGDEWGQIRARAVLPIRMGNKIIGLLDLQSPYPILQPSFDITGLEMLAGEVSIAIQNADLYQEMLRARERAESLAVENAALYNELLESSIQDELTCVLNRRGLLQRGRNELIHGHRLKYQVSFLMFDLDNFKIINDTYGHAVGDQVLYGVASTCKEKIRDIDIIGRYGGDEFVIILPGCTLETAGQVGERLRCGVEQVAFSTSEDILHVTISIGVAVGSAEELNFEDLFHKADQALYAAKLAGKNTIRKYLP